MKSRTIDRYIFFGTSLRYLQDTKAGIPVHGKGALIANIDSFLNCLSEFELPVTLRAASKLRTSQEELAELPPDHVVNEEEAKELKDIAHELRPTLFAEAGGNVAFIATEKRLDVNKLLSDVGALLAPGVLSSVPDIAQHDFREAGKCIAFELPTAAAFHLLRGTEDTLRDFYCSIVKRNRPEPLMWGNMVSSLRQRRRGAPPEILLDNLDNIRRSFRNPTQHPDKIYDIHEVQDLFGLCVDVVNRMANAKT